MYRHEYLEPCGCWFVDDRQVKRYIRQVDLKVHSTILSTTSRTTLTQTFVNLSLHEIKNAAYTFPLYDGASVVAFKYKIGDSVAHGVVKERDEARAEYEEATKKGQTAAILEQYLAASDTFTTSIGRIPRESKAVIHITYLGELQHDAQADGTRFTIPTAIAPRYSSQTTIPNGITPDLKRLMDQGTIDITVDVQVERQAAIRRLHSPSHPVAVTLGKISSAAEGVFEANQASATLMTIRKNIVFEADFVLLVNAQGQDAPCAFLETHPTIPNQRALMASLVPKFNLSNIMPEIVFIIDRSGSMRDKIETLKSALKVFLKSLPLGVKFNICSFGSRHSFMWEKSKTYDQSSLDEALRYADTVASNFGGTDILSPVKATVKNRYKDMALEVLLLTDGEIWDQESLFAFIGEAAAADPIRFFSLGIGDTVSHSLVQGVARAGNGFSQSVGTNEQLDQKVVRMLKGALTPHVKNYTLEAEYETDADEDYEIVEKANEVCAAPSPPPDAMEVDRKENPNEQQPISLFDPNFKETEIQSGDQKNCTSRPASAQNSPDAVQDSVTLPFQQNICLPSAFPRGQRTKTKIGDPQGHFSAGTTGIDDSS